MEFEEQYLKDINIPILTPQHYEILGTHNGRITYQDTKTGEEKNDEPLFIHEQTRIFLNEFRKEFANDSIIVLIFSKSNKLYLQKRSASKKWAPNKIDLASIAGQRRALIKNNAITNEGIRETALREISEETGIEIAKLSLNNLSQIGTHYNSHTNEHQTIFAYPLDTPIEELNSYIQENGIEEVAEWFEQDYTQTMQEYFGQEIDKYAGGIDMRPVNFISNPDIKTNLNNFFDRLQKS